MAGSGGLVGGAGSSQGTAGGPGAASRVTAGQNRPHLGLCPGLNAHPYAGGQDCRDLSNQVPESSSLIAHLATPDHQGNY